MTTNPSSRNVFVACVLRCLWTTLVLTLGAAPLALLFAYLPGMPNAAAFLPLIGVAFGFIGAIVPGKLRLLFALSGAVASIALGATAMLSTQLYPYIGLGILSALLSLTLPVLREDGMPTTLGMALTVVQALMPLVVKIVGTVGNPPLLLISSFYLIVYLINTNMQSLQAQCSSHQQRPAQSMRLGNLLLTIVLFLLVLLISQFALLRDAFESFMQSLILLILYLISKLVPGNSDAGGGGGGGADMDLSGLGTKETAEFWKYLEYIGIVVAVVAVIALLIWFSIRVYKLLKVVWGHIRAFMNRYAQSLKTDYVDQTEDLSGWGEIGKSLRDQLGRAAARFKPIHWESLDNRERIRAAYTAVLRREKQPDLARTARETLLSGANTGKSDVQTLCDSYERARYSEHPITDAEAENAKRAL